jgi:CHASE2 domain-containing sensor protein
MLDEVLRALQTSATGLSEWWDSINTTYRAGGCLLTSFFLMWEATHTKSEDRDRKFFLTGILALGLLGYGALLFIYGNAH